MTTVLHVAGQSFELATNHDDSDQVCAQLDSDDACHFYLATGAHIRIAGRTWSFRR